MRKFVCSEYLEDLEFSIKNSFYKLCDEEDYDGILLFLNNFKYLNLATCDNSEYFVIAAEKGNLNLIKLFIEFGADVHYDNYFFEVIAYHEYDDCLEYLLDVHKMDIENIKNMRGYSYAKQFILNRSLLENAPE
jgi:hypothetical protein